MTLPYPQIPPVAFRIGPLAVRWYGLMYLLGYIVGGWLARVRSKRALWTLTPADVDALITYLLIGMLIGARIVYVFVYDWAAYRAHPLNILAIWHGGLSFHGAALGMALASALFARTRRMPWLMVADGIAVCATPGLFFGRIGNFINGELFGRPTSVSWAMIFPSDPTHLPRHPSQLYEAVCEGLLLGAFLWLLQSRLAKRARETTGFRDGFLAGAFLIGYGFIRFALEFARQPDAQLGLVAGPFSMGQILSALTIAAGMGLIIAARARAPRPLRAPSPAPGTPAVARRS